MRAVRLVQLGKPLEKADISIPQIGSSDALIRVAAAGICHSDAHYRDGISKIDRLPLTLGHEVAGTVERVGKDVRNVSRGDRVCVHYLVSCGSCEFCARGLEQFCRSGQMIGKHRDGGYAEFIKVPGANVFPLPDEIPLEVGAIMMCSSNCATCSEQSDLQTRRIDCDFWFRRARIFGVAIGTRFRFRKCLRG